MAELISIVIPAYNAELYIESAVQSALEQTFGDVEVIVVDDGSVDETVDRVKRIVDPRLRLIRQENRGQSVAINFGVEHARGTHVKLLDADDWLNPEHVEKQLAAIRGTDGCVASCAWGPFVQDFKNPLRQREHTNRDYESPTPWILDSLAKDSGMMGGWMWLIPISIWKKAGGYAPELSYCPNNDFEFSVRLLLASSGVRYADGAVYSYRQGVSQALSLKRDNESMKSIYEATEMGTALLLDAEDSPRVRRICANRFQKWLYQFYPDHPELVSAAENRIEELGGSDLALQGGKIAEVLLPIIGWKGVRRLQSAAYRFGWGKVLLRKSHHRLKALN